MKKIMLFVAICLMSTAFASASPYEWIVGDVEMEDANAGTCTYSNFSIGGNLGYNVTRWCNYDLLGTVEGTSTYDENVAFYYQEYDFQTGEPSEDSDDWSFFRRASLHSVYGYATKEKVTLPYQSELDVEIRTHINMSSGLYWVRFTTNYDGAPCDADEWTPTPNVNSCGDTADRLFSVS